MTTFLVILLWLFIGFVCFGWHSYNIWKNRCELGLLEDKEYKIFDYENFVGSNAVAFLILSVLYTFLGPANILLQYLLCRRAVKEGNKLYEFKLRLGWKLY